MAFDSNVSLSWNFFILERLKASPMTLYMTTCNCLGTAWQLPDNYLTTDLPTNWKLSDNWLHYDWLPADCLLTAYQLSEDCLPTACQLPANCQLTTQQLSDNCMLTACLPEIPLFYVWIHYSYLLCWQTWNVKWWRLHAYKMNCHCLYSAFMLCSKGEVPWVKNCLGRCSFLFGLIFVKKMLNILTVFNFEEK